MENLAPAYVFSLMLMLLSISSLQAQVGINTTNPRTTLEVAGSVQINDNVEIVSFNSVQDSDTHNFLIQKPNDKIRSMDVSRPTGVALGYIQEFIITNPDEDWVLDFDTGVRSNDYVLITISASYDKELITSNSAGASDNASLPYTATFIQGGTWHIIADFPMAANRNSSEIGTWTIKTLIYSKDLSKQFGTVNVPMSNGTTGSAVTPILD